MKKIIAISLLLASGLASAGAGSFAVGYVFGTHGGNGSEGAKNANASLVQAYPVACRLMDKDSDSDHYMSCIRFNPSKIVPIDKMCSSQGMVFIGFIAVNESDVILACVPPAKE